MSWVASSFDKELLFKKPAVPPKTKNVNKTTKKCCTKLWNDEFIPTAVEELAIHKKKIQEVQLWLSKDENGNKKSNKNNKILLLSGPPGCGKSATIRVVSKMMNFILREWINSNSIPQQFFFNETSGETTLSYKDFQMRQADKFCDFLLRSSKYKSVCDDAVGTSLILVEELPNALYLNPREFHEILRNYCSSCYAAVVFVVSESNKCSTITNMFPPELQEELNISNIVFNPVSTTLVSSALSRIASLAGFDSTASASTIRQIAAASDGDLRSAVNALHFALINDAKSVEGSPALKKPSRKASGRGMKRLREETAPDTDASVATKDSILLLFRALGKILYCKRDETKPMVGSLPKHLEDKARVPPLECDPEGIVERSWTDASIFGLFLHHNATSFASSIEQMTQLSTYLADADIIQGNLLDPSGYLAQYASSVCTRGAMHVLGVNSKSSNTFRPLTKPAWLTATQTMRERRVQLRRFFAANPGVGGNLGENILVTGPLAAKMAQIAMPGESKGSSQFLREMVLFSSLPQRCFPPLPGVAKTVTPVVFDQDEDEEFVIEEIDD